MSDRLDANRSMEAVRARLRGRFLTVVLFLGLAGLPAAAGCITDIYCSIDLTYLPSLKADPLAEMDLPGIELARRSAQGEGRALGKPVHADVRRVYRIADQREADAVLAEAVSTAQSLGWVL